MDFSEASIEALNDVSAEIVATVLAPGVHQRGEVRRRKDLFAATRHAGRETVQE